MDNQNTSLAGYKYLLTYQYTTVIYDLTIEFCQFFLPGRELLRQKGLSLWQKDDEKMRELRVLRVIREPFPHIPQFPHIPHNPELTVNLLLMLCQRTTYLLEKQIESLRTKFIKEGGFRENLFRQRMEQKMKHP